MKEGLKPRGTTVRKSGNTRKFTEPLTVSEVSEAERKIVKAVQEQLFAEDVSLKKWKLARLFEQDGLIRVGGRWNRSR